MQLDRIDYDPASALAFYEESLSALGATCERTWHDRLEVLVEGPAATLWDETGSLQAQELRFAPADVSVARDATHEIFPGCPLTFRLAQLLRPKPLVLEKVVLRDSAGGNATDPAVMEKLWRAQFPATRHWRLLSEPRSAWHHSLISLVRCEIQAIEQHWSLHRLAMALPGGEGDDHLAAQIPFIEVENRPETDICWPAADSARWWPLLHRQIEAAIQNELNSMRARQERYLQRELARIDDYFALYEKELEQRGHRRQGAGSVKTADRIAAARAEHARRREDQVLRHEVSAQPHLDWLLLAAEPAWEAAIEADEARSVRRLQAVFVPRARRWFGEEHQ